MRKLDRTLFYLVLTLTFLGLIAVADASAPQALASFDDKFFFLKQQSLWAVIGVIALFIFSKIKYTFWQRFATPFFWTSVTLLVLVLIPGLSYKAFGARRWIDLGFFSFQPTEIIKLALVMYFAKLANNAKATSSYLIPIVAILGLIMLQPDLGTALVISAISFSQIFVSGISLMHLIVTGVLGLLSVAGLILISPYRRDRLTTFLEATSDPLGKGYHIRQILLALGSGGLIGIGIGGSRQKYLFLPEASSDSIFAVIAEETGLIGATIIISLFILFLLKGFKIARNAPDKFSKVVAVGITSWIAGQAFLNIASMVSLVPLTGVPLPFFSYGGSSLVMILSACGILLNISKWTKKQ
ncbi:MAG: putative lipid II flippase FtsW [Patescibacteria group bacterium]